MTGLPLKNHKVAFTGQFLSFTRAGARALVEDAGGQIVGGPQHGATILVVGYEGQMSERKTAAARKAGIEMLNEDSFLALIGKL